MSKERVTAFSDGVIAILITVMVLELKTPDGVDLSALLAAAPVFFSYVLSFVYIAIYWNNHHHFFQLVRRVDGLVLWANMHLLFWLSLVPFMTRWMDESGFATVPVFIYGANLMLAAIAYAILQAGFIRQQGPGGRLARAIGKNVKARVSPAIYIAGYALTFASPVFGLAAYAVVAAIWLVPDRGMERVLRAGGA